MFKNYKIGFDVGGFILLLLIMIPNTIWFIIAIPNDILRIKSTTNFFNFIVLVSQMLMIVALVLFINTKRNKLKLNSKFIILSLICCIIYFVSWLLYSQGINNKEILLSLTIFPCLTFLFYEIDRKNFIAIIPTIIFAIFHLISTLFNFVLS